VTRFDRDARSWGGSSTVNNAWIEGFYFPERRSLDTPTQQTVVSDSNTPAIRTYFFYTGIGFLEFLVLGFGRQINDDWAVSIKFNEVFLSGGFIGPNAAYGVGIRFSYFLRQDFSLFNAIHIEPTYLADFFGPHRGKREGLSFQIAIGDEEKQKRGISLSWSLGGVVSSATGSPPLYFPSAKIGLNWNL